MQLSPIARAFLAPGLLATSLIAQRTPLDDPPQDPKPPTRQTTGEQKVDDDGDPVVVTARRPGGDYAKRDAVSTTRSEASLFETPGSVQVVGEQVYKDQGTWRLKDVYRNVSGVQPIKTEGFALTFESAFVRGFQQEPYLNGGRTFGLGPVDLQGVERVEILKGPASLLYGAIEPGGVINLVPKRPSFTEQYSASAQFGSFDYYRASFDATGPLDDQGEVAYRVAGAYQDAGSFRDSVEDQSLFLAPSLAWNLDDATRLNIWLWYQNIDRPVDDGVAFSSAGQPIAPIKTFLGDPRNNTQNIDDTFGGLTFEHDFGQALTFRQEVQVHVFDAENNAARRFGGTSATNTVAPFYDASEFDQWDINSRTELLLTGATGSVQHEVLAGVQTFYQNYIFKRRRDTATLSPISIVNPVFPPVTYTINNIGRNRSEITFVGLYVQDHMRFLDERLHVLAGARLDYIQQDNNPGSQEDYSPTWQGGALYEATPWLAPYVSVATSFNPTGPNAVTIDGSNLDPERGVQYEAGVKVSAFDEKLQVTTAVYEITKEDVSIADPTDSNFQVNAGELRSRGFELDVVGRVVPGLNVIGSYAYTDTEVINSSALPVGARFRGIPLHSGSLWLRYDGFMEGSTLEGLGLGAGVFSSSSKAGDNNGTFDLAGYTRLDLASWYDLPLENGSNVRFQLNLLNVTDEEYYESSFNVARVQPGQPFTVLGEMRIDF